MNRREGLLTGFLGLTFVAQLVAVLLLVEPATPTVATPRPVPLPSTYTAKPISPQTPRPVVTLPPQPPPAAEKPIPTVLVTGKVRDASGRAIPGATVITTRHVSGFESFFTAVSIITTLGLACTVGACDVDEVRDTTDASGTFRLRLPVASRLGVADQHDVTVALPDGTTTVLQHSFTGRPTDLGAIRVLTQTASASRSGGQLRIAVPILAGSLGGDLKATAVLYGSGDKPVLTLPDVRTGRAVDGRLAEKGVSRLALRITGKDALGRSVLYSGRTTGVPAGPVPLSRGHSCHGYGPGDRSIPLRPCRFTDGDLSSEVMSPYSVGDLACQSQKRCSARNSSLLIDLGSVRALHAVVLHGATFDITVETSVDGRRFTQVARTETFHDDDVLLPVSGSGRYVRIHYDFSIDLRTAREASVF